MPPQTGTSPAEGIQGNFGGGTQGKGYCAEEGVLLQPPDPLLSASLWTEEEPLLFEQMWVPGD